jgi:DNA end-binding protein Ku
VALMAQRPVWRGHLRLALVSCPVALYKVHQTGGDLHFHLINPDTGHRVRMITVDADTEEEVPRQSLVKGYEFERDRYVLLTEADFEGVKIESSSTIEIERFVPADAIDPIYFDASYVVGPDGDAGRDVYVVLREAIIKTRRLALSRVVISQRERVIAIAPLHEGLVAHTLRELRDLRQADEIFAAVPRDRPDPEMVQLAIQLIDRQTAKFDAAVTQDRYEARLQELIDAKLRGEGLQPVAHPETGRGKVIDLKAALRRSLGGLETARSRPAVGKETSRPAASKPAKRARMAAKKRNAAQR